MAQQKIILKRSAVPGRVPDTSSINLGEVAINTYDGKLYFKKSGSVESVETILTTNTIASGSIQVSEDITAQRDLYVVRDIITIGDIDAGGDISGSGLSINDTVQITHNNIQLSGSMALTGSMVASSFSGDGSGLTNIVVDLSTAQLNEVDANNIPPRSFAELYVGCATLDIVDLDFNN